jgi:hypothetical protein
MNTLHEPCHEHQASITAASDLHAHFDGLVYGHLVQKRRRRKEKTMSQLSVGRASLQTRLADIICYLVDTDSDGPLEQIHQAPEQPEVDGDIADPNVDIVCIYYLVKGLENSTKHNSLNI